MSAAAPNSEHATPGAPRLSVLIPVWRPVPDQLRAAVASILGQTASDFELLLVANSGEPPLEPVLGRLADDPRVVILPAPAGASLATALNVGLAAARAPWIARLDADDVAEPQRLARQLERLAADPDLDVLGTWITAIDAADRVLGSRRLPTGDAAIRRTLRRRNPIAHPTVVVRRSALRAAGGYRERPSGVCEDYDLWCRLAADGRRFANLPEPLVRYRLHDASSKQRALRATLRETIAIKREHFAGRLDLGDRLRLLGERTLLALPPGLVTRLFRLLALRPATPTTGR